MPSTPVVVLDSTLTNIANAIRGKNGSSDTYKPSEMPAAITAIPSGGGVGIPREVRANGVYGAPAQSFTFSLPSDATNVADYALYYAFYGCTAITSADLSSLTAVDGYSSLCNAFYNCTGLTSIDLSSLTDARASTSFSGAFRGCTALASVDLSSLVAVIGGSDFSNAFQNCTSLTSIDLSSLTTVSGINSFATAFSGCTSLTSINFSSLTTVTGYSAFSGAFQGCTSLTSLSFPALTASGLGSYTNQFNNMLYGVTGCTVHFPAAAQAKIETLSTYPNFGGTNTTVLFDL